MCVRPDNLQWNNNNDDDDNESIIIMMQPERISLVKWIALDVIKHDVEVDLYFMQ